MSDFKTMTEIEEITKNRSNHNGYTYVRAWALTTFLQQLEDKHKENFRVLSAHPSIIKHKSDKTVPERFSIGLWAKWLIGETIFYLEMNENIFFSPRFIKSYIQPKKYGGNEIISEYLDSDGTYIYSNIENWGDFKVSQNVHDILLANMHEALDEVKERIVPMYKQEMPSYKSVNKQELYFN